MPLNFTELTTTLRAGHPITPQNIHDILTASAAATFALAELAADHRRTHYSTTLTLTNHPTPATPSTLLEITSPLDPNDLTTTIADLTADPTTAIAVDFISTPAPITPMQALRVLAALRLASPATSLHLGPSRHTTLKSLQPLALHIINSLTLLTYPHHNAATIFEDLKLIRDTGLTTSGTTITDLTQHYIQDLTNHGIPNAPDLANAILTPPAPTGGCGGNCACGSGGCS